MLNIYRNKTWIALVMTMVFVFSLAVVAPSVTAADNDMPGPKVIAAEITNKGDLSLTFDQVLANPAGTQGLFTVIINDAQVNVNAVETTNTPGKIKLVLEKKAAAGQELTVIYAPGEDEALQLKSVDGVAVQEFSYSNSEQPELVAAPVLTADNTENQVGKDIDITFASNPDWSGKITNIKVNDVSIRDKYTVGDGQITIKAAVFAEAGDYTIVIKATGYEDASLTQTIIASEVEEPGSEVKVVLNDIKGHWAQANIEQLVALGAIGGYPDGSFAPEKSISRAEFTSILVKAFKLEGAADKVFADTQNHWAKDAIAVAYANNIISGYDNDKFGPDDPITREQMAVMVVKAAKLELVSGEANFTDSNRISTWAAEAVNTAYSNKLISGYPDQSFGPANNASRAEAATVIFNAMQK